MNEEPQGVNLSDKMCPIDGAVCDRKCGFAFHGTITRKSQNIILPEDPMDALMCESCQ